MRSTKKNTSERCEYCGEKLRRCRVRVYRYRRKRHVLFQRVPALVCPGCGHRVFEAAAVEAMEHQLNGPTPAKRRVGAHLARQFSKPERSAMVQTKASVERERRPGVFCKPAPG